MSKSAIGRMGVMVVMVLGMLALAAPAAWATEFSVNNTNDASDANPTDGVCDADSEAEGNQCTLRAAIQEANAQANVQGEADVINVPAGTYTLNVGGAGEDDSATGDLDITQALTINGAGATSTTVAGSVGFGDRIFQNHSSANTTISGLTITGGSAEGPLDGLNDGAGIRNTGTLTVSDSAVSGNKASYGGGLWNEDGTLTVERSTISGNTATAIGGGINSWTSDDFTTSKTTITNSTISGNSATDHGGGVYNARGLTEIEHSTITNNTVESGEGSGVLSYGDDRTSTEVYSSIISDNTNTDNAGTDVDFIPGHWFPTNSFVSEGYNLIGDGSATAAFNPQSGDQVNETEPGLEPLSLNAPGSTKTHALQESSPALNAGSPSAQYPPPATDQRGVKRPQQSRCDIGSFERDATAPWVKTVVPAQNATGISPGANVTATFSEAMRETSVKSAFKLYKKGSTTAIRATVTYYAASKSAVLNPSANLQRGASYKAVVASGAKDLAGNALDQNPSVAGNQNKVWYFTIRR